MEDQRTILCSWLADLQPGADPSDARLIILRPPQRIPNPSQAVTFGSGYNQGVQVTHPNDLFRALIVHINSETMRILAANSGLMTPHAHFQLEQNLSGVWYRVDPLSVFE